jgi:hypothetical protein
MYFHLICLMLNGVNWFMLMRIMKSIAHREHMVATSSSSIEDELSLSADQEEAPGPTHDVASSSAVS